MCDIRRIAGTGVAHGNVVVTGNPVRAEIVALHADSRTLSQSQAPPQRKPELLVLGGSQGADTLNEAVMGAIRRLRELFCDWTIVHQTGPRQVEQVRQLYRELGLIADVEPFIHDMPGQYATASLVISPRRDDTRRTRLRGTAHDPASLSARRR